MTVKEEMKEAAIKAVKCPTCGAEAGQGCRKKLTGPQIAVRIEMLSGWEPFGGVCVSHGNFLNPIGAQAMIRKTEQPST